MKITTIYAARILGYITMKGNTLTTAGEIVENVDISYQYCLKVMNEMKRAGILVSEQGCKGGYRMKKRPEDVSIYEILNLFEYNHSNGNGREELESDPFNRFMKQIYEEAAKNLKQFTIMDIYGKETKTVQEEMAAAE